MGEKKDSISKEEMDALLEEEKGPSLALSDVATLRNLFRPAFEAMATALSTILKSDVLVSPVEIRTISPERLKEETKEAVFVAEFSYKGPFAGLTYLILKKRAGAIIADLLMGGDGTTPPDEINELYLGAVGEAVSQMMNSSTSTLSTLVGSRVSISSAKVRIVELASEIGLSLFKEETLVEISSKMKIDGLLEESLLIQLLPVSLAKAIVTAKTGPVLHPSAVHPVQFAPLKPGGIREVPSNIDLLMDVPMRVSVELGRTSMLLKDILQLGTGSIIELDKMAGEPVEVLVNGKLIAKGNVVVIDENFGLRITDIVSPSERLENLREEF